jgi:hypothetical protein
MPGSRADRQLERWGQVANEVVLPTEPPRTNASSRFGITTVAAAVVLLAIVLGIPPNLPGATTVPPRATAASASSDVSAISVPPSASAMPASVPPTPISSVPSPSRPPNGGCTSDQFGLGTPATGPGGSAFGTESVYVHIQLTNMGAECALRVPATVTAESSSGETQSVDVESAMTSQTYVARAGQSFMAVIGAWWPFPGSPQVKGCTATIKDVTTVYITLPAGRLDIALDRPWSQACLSPATVSLEYRK